MRITLPRTAGLMVAGVLGLAAFTGSARAELVGGTFYAQVTEQTEGFYSNFLSSVMLNDYITGSFSFDTVSNDGAGVGSLTLSLTDTTNPVSATLTDTDAVGAFSAGHYSISGSDESNINNDAIALSFASAGLGAGFQGRFSLLPASGSTLSLANGESQLVMNIKSGDVDVMEPHGLGIFGLGLVGLLIAQRRRGGAVSASMQPMAV